MKKSILDRYDKSENGEFIVNISTKKIEDLYDNFDNTSSFLKKDLNQELVNYVIESVREIGNEPFVLKFYFKESIDESYKKKIIESIFNFFEYLQELEDKKKEEQIKNSFIFIILGFLFVTLSLAIGKDEDMFSEVLAEGIMVAGWVSLWEAVAIFLIKWFPLAKKIKLFKKISIAKVEFAQ